ncbi:MAG: hypothetical protein QXN71_04070, partial [Candidatus Aenigmatarchaeota archaeon]
YITDCGDYDFPTILWKINCVIEKYKISLVNTSDVCTLKSYDSFLQVPDDDGRMVDINFTENSHKAAFAFIKDNEGNVSCRNGFFFMNRKGEGVLCLSENPKSENFDAELFIREIEKCCIKNK